MTVAFGHPSPLPGQPGFRVRPSEVMAREAAEMEKRLARLKKDLANETREAAGPRTGGARWRSSRADRGSVGMYAKDVKIRHQQQLQKRPPHGIFASGSVGAGGQIKPQAGAGARAAAALRDEQQNRYRRKVQDKRGKLRDVPFASETEECASELQTFGGREISQWSVADTLEWLESLGLGIHSGVFQRNEISGPILLEVGLDDLDYMNVTVLGHRKIILKGIEELRRGGVRANADMLPPPVPAHAPPPKESNSIGGRKLGGVEQSAENSMLREKDFQEENRHYPREQKKQHCSHAEMMSSTKTEGKNGRRGPMRANLADGEYDEAAASSSFAEAVAEWRGPRRPLPQSDVPCRAPMDGMSASERVMIVGNTGVRGEGKGRRLLGRSAVTECWTNPFAAPPAKGSEATSQEDQLGEIEPGFVSPPRLKKAVFGLHKREGVRKEDGAPTLDEEAEHAAFCRAVAEWNLGSKIAANEGCDNSKKEAGVVSRADRTTTRTTGSASIRTAEMMAEALREQMDAEHRQLAQKLEETKRNMLEVINTASTQRKPGEGGQVEVDADELMCVGGTGEWGESTGYEELVSEENKSLWDEDSRDCIENEWVGEENESLVPASLSSSGAANHSKFEGTQLRERELKEGGGDVDIQLIESVLGGGVQSEDVGSYLVDEGGSSDDECL